MKIKINEFFGHIRTFMTVFMTKARCSSHNTIRSYRVTLKLFLKFIKDVKGLNYSDLDNSVLTVAVVCEFISWLHENQKCSASTCNLRLTLIKRFCHYIAEQDPGFIQQWILISEIKPLTEPKKPVVFLSESDLKLLLTLPNQSSVKGKRDSLLLIMMYETGARLAEIQQLRVCDIRKIDEQNFTCELTGKGQKTRIVPICRAVFKHFDSFVKANNLTQEDFVFTNKIHGKVVVLSQSTIYKIVREYGNKLHALSSSAPSHLHPHMLRHTRAMHLYNSGCYSLDLIAQILGHSQLETTRIYAEASMELKQRALKKVTNLTNSYNIHDTNHEVDNLDEDELLLTLSGLGVK